MLGVFGSEYGWDTLRTLFTQRPGRLQVLAAKLAALAIALVPFVLGCSPRAPSRATSSPSSRTRP
jgi:ABC-type transport system involved in multi-copper enzyme maturation permease subunit